MISKEAQQRGADANRKAAAERDQRILFLLESGASWAEVASHFGMKRSSVGTAITRARRRNGIPARLYRTGAES